MKWPVAMVLAAVTILTTACKSPVPGRASLPPLAPSAPASSAAQEAQPSISPQPAATGPSTLSGLVYEHSAAGTAPLANFSLHVDAVSESNHPVVFDVVTDSTGRYEIPGLSGEYVKVSAQPQESYLSPCSVRMWLWYQGDSLNLHVISRASFLATGIPESMPPFSKPRGYESVEPVSGTVTETTPDGVRPVGGARVEHLYGNGLSGYPNGFTLTDSTGHYVLCDYLDDYGQVLRVSKDAYRTSIEPIRWTPKMDIQIVRD